MTPPLPDPQSRPVRIGNCSGFYGDRMAAMREMLEGGPLDVLTGDYLAELTMLILYRSRAKDPARGYATTFLRQLQDCLGLVADRGVRIVVNAGGLNPAGCAEAVRALAERLGVALGVAHVEGDDLMPRLEALREHGLPHVDTGAPLTGQPLTANAYLGGWGVTAALAGGAQVVVTGRTTDAALTSGPAAWWHGWAPHDWDALAGAVVTGHVLECGAQATGGNYSFFREVPGLTHPGFPLAEISADGSAVITKHSGTGGLVSVGTVTAQLLYELGGPEYLGPDVTAHFDTICLTDVDSDRVRVTGVRGTPPPATTKVAMNLLGGFRNSTTFVLTGPDIEAKAALLQETLAPVLAGIPEVDVRLARTDHPDADTEEAASALLRVTVKAPTPEPVGRAFSSPAIELALASYPGFHVTAPPGDATPYGVYWPTLVPGEVVEQVVVHADGRREPVARVVDIAGSRPVAARPRHEPPPHPAQPGGPTRRVPLGDVAGARSGDKGGTANLGVWVRTAEAYAWLAAFLTVERVQALLPETAALPVTRHELPNLRAVNLVLPGLLGEGVASSTRFDPQAKALGEWLRSRLVDVPEVLLAP